jgi:hypothetical protein
MNAWERVNKELEALKKDWYWLSAQLEASINTANHWKTRGIPAKYYTAIETLLGKPPRWITGESTPFAPPSDLSASAIEIAVLFDMIPAGDRMSRAQAFNDATTAIMKVLRSLNATGPVGTE